MVQGVAKRIGSILILSWCLAPGQAAGRTENAFGNLDVNSPKKYDRGYDTFRGMADVNGDGLADYCRFVGNPGEIFLSCGLATTARTFGSLDVNSAKNYDAGYDTFRAMVDVNQDGRADYCRFVGDPGEIFLSCGLATAAGTIGNLDVNSAKNYDAGYDTFRAMADVNADGRADYCRFVGDPGEVFLACGLATAAGTIGNLDVRSAKNYDAGYDTFRAMADVDGDGRADYCRFVGDSGAIFLSCGLATAGGGFGNNDFNSAPGLDPGYPELRTLVDVNADRRADYCRIVGNPPATFVSCALAGPTGFGSNDFNSRPGYDVGYPEFRALADVNGDGRGDYCRFVGDSEEIFLSAGLATGITLIDIIPATLSGETNQDSEPFLAVHPTQPLRMAASSFTPNPAGTSATTAPIFISSSGGRTWTLNNVVPSQSMTGDITHAFNATGSLHGGILRVPGSLLLNELVTLDFLSPTVMTVQAFRDRVDQPFVQARRGHDNRVYVGNNDFGAAGGRTATLDVSGNGGTTFNSVRLEPRATSGQNGPSVRPTVAMDGTVYAAYFGWRTFAGGVATSDIVVVRDDNGGLGLTPFRDLLGGDGLPGQLVAAQRTIPFMNRPILGQERIGSTLTIAVDPLNSSIVYVAWGDRVGNGDIYTLHVRRSTDRGVTWSTEDLRTLTNATNPALAVTERGVVGLLYQQVAGTVAAGRWVTHLAQSNDFGTTWSDMVLASVPATAPAPQFLPYLGDYAHLLAVKDEFHGIFSTSNVPDAANFPAGVTYQRSANFLTRRLNDGSGGFVAVSIDPFYFALPAIPPLH